MRAAWSLAIPVLLCGCSSSPKHAENSEIPASVETPDHYRVNFETTQGNFVVEAVSAWAPKGAARFHKLVHDGFYDGARFYRVRPKFVVQWGISQDPKTNELWKQLKITDDPVKQSNQRGFVSFATDGPNTRTTEVFINLVDNKRLDARGFAPFGRVSEGMDVVDKLYSGYGEVQGLHGPGVDAVQYQLQGEGYIQRHFPKLDQIKSARIVQ
jgi:peptidyl-prolyl cis-trans isomerase A (cyclophilin A)